MDEKELKTRLQKFELEAENIMLAFECMEKDLHWMRERIEWQRERIEEQRERLNRLEKNEEKLHMLHSLAIIAVAVGLILHAVL